MWAQVISVTLSAALTVLAADLLIQRIQPLPPEKTDVGDGVAEVTQPGPDVLVFGSSHTRSFHPLKDELRKRSGHERVAIFTLESGWGVSFEWAFDHRVASLLEEKGPGGAPLRAFTRVVIPLTVTDLCGKNDHTNIPRDAWYLSDFVADVVSNGLNDYSRSYLPPRLAKMLPFSILVQRGLNVLETLKDSVRSEKGAKLAVVEYAQNVHARYQGASSMCPEPTEIMAFERLLTKLAKLNLEITVILFALPPDVLDGPNDPLLRPYRKMAADLAHRHNVRLLDWVTSTPLGMTDFMPDRDHATPEGNVKLMSWALAGDLAGFAQPTSRHASNEP